MRPEATARIAPPAPSTRADLAGGPPAGFSVIFDWDGVIVDSAAQHEASWEQLAAEERRALPADHFKASFGKKNEWIIPHLFRWTEDPAEVRRLSLRKEALYRRIILAQGLEPLPGVREQLRQLQAEGVRCWIGSSTHRENITIVLRGLGLEDLFGGMVTSEDVRHGKPHPEVFLRAAVKLQQAPGRCVVFEDSPAGIAAARAAGMKVIGVATTHAPGALAPSVDRVVRRLDEIPAKDLRALFPD
jgi:HAD superfamily hydrolase (TIGR01509 family)